MARTSLKLIVREGVSLTHDDLGGNILMMADGICRNGCPTLCRDMKEELESRGYSFEIVNDPHYAAAMRVAAFPPEPGPLKLDPQVRAAMRALNKQPALQG